AIPAASTAVTTRARVRNCGRAAAPIAGRSVTNAATPSRITITSGRSTSAEMAAAPDAPSAALSTASPAAGSATGRSTFVVRVYVTAADAVPKTEEILFVAI